MKTTNNFKKHINNLVNGGEDVRLLIKSKSDGYIIQMNFDINLLLNKEKREITIGDCELYKINYAAIINNGEDFLLEMDSMSTELEGLCTAITRKGKIDKKLFPDFLDNSIIYIHKIKLLPEYRGYKLGRHIIRAILEVVASYNDLITIMPYPDSEEEVTKILLKKFQNYWENIGFKRIRRTEYFSLENFK